MNVLQIASKRFTCILFLLSTDSILQMQWLPEVCGRSPPVNYISSINTFLSLFQSKENNLLQSQRPRVSARPQNIPVQSDEVAIRQKPKITVNTTPLYQIQTQTTAKVTGITARPNNRDSFQTNPPATTYRPAIQFFTQKSAPITFSKPGQLAVDLNRPTHFATTRRPIEFAAEFHKFQQENNIVATTTATPSRVTNQKNINSQAQKVELPNVTQDPIYETQLVFDPQTGQIDSSLFPQNVAYRIPAAYVSSQQSPFNPSPQALTLEQLQQQNHESYHRPLQPPTTRVPLQLPQFSQQVTIVKNLI